MTAPFFLDTVGLIAVWESKDQWHPAASEAAERMRAEKAPSFTTSYILAECANAAARKPYRKDVARLREELEEAGQLVPTPPKTNGKRPGAHIASAKGEMQAWWINCRSSS